MATRRVTDRHVVASVWGRWGRDLITALAVGLAAWAVLHLGSEVNTRKTQTCLLFERQHRAAVEQLRETYAFLVSPPVTLKALVPIALTQVAQTEASARSSTEPAYCDKPGVGLPGPAPVIPRRPAAITKLLAQHHP